MLGTKILDDFSQNKDRLNFPDLSYLSNYTLSE